MLVFVVLYLNSTHSVRTTEYSGSTAVALTVSCTLLTWLPLATHQHGAGSITLRAARVGVHI